MRWVVFSLLVFCGSSLQSNYSLTLEQAQQLALNQNKDLLVLENLLEKAKQGRLEAFSKWWPQIRLMSRGYQTEKTQVGTECKSAFLSQVSLVQSLFSTDKYYNTRLATLQVQELTSLLEALRLDVLFHVRVLYYQLVFDEKALEIAKENIVIFEELSQKERKNYQIGTNILLNLNQSKVAVANALNTYYRLQRNFEVDQDALLIAMGFEPGGLDFFTATKEFPLYSLDVIAPKLAKMEAIFAQKNPQSEIFSPHFPQNLQQKMLALFPKKEVEEWEFIALENRPDLWSKEVAVAMAANRIEHSKGAYLPEVWLEANYGGYPARMLDNPSSSFLNQQFNWAVGFGVEWLLFDGFGREYRLYQTKYEKQAKCHELEKGVQQIYGEVRKQLFDIEEAIASFLTSRSNVILAEQTLDLAKKQLDIGTITIFDYQYVVDGLIQALNVQNQASFDIIKSYFGLIHATGKEESL